MCKSLILHIVYTHTSIYSKFYCSLNKIEIIIDFDELRGQLYYANTQKKKSEYFSKRHQVIPMIIVTNLHYNFFIRSGVYSCLLKIQISGKWMFTFAASKFWSVKPDVGQISAENGTVTVPFNSQRSVTVRKPVHKTMKGNIFS